MNKQTKRVRREATTWQEVKTRREGMEVADDFFGLLVGGSGYVDQHLTLELVARSTESCLFVVRQCRKIATQKCADTQVTMSPNLPCRDENRQHFAMSPTLPAKDFGNDDNEDNNNEAIINCWLQSGELDRRETTKARLLITAVISGILSIPVAVTLF
jgi:hypothetical protein